MKFIEIVCANCNKNFQKDFREYKRQIKNAKYRFFCNRSCLASKRNSENKPDQNTIKGQEKIKKLIDQFGGKTRRDQYSPFRWFILRAEFRNKKKHYDCNITVEYLKNLWEDQKGICPLTGWNLLLPNSTRKAWKYKDPANASLDRIDNSKGYIEGNVRFVAVMANYARNNFSDDQLIEFCKSVTNNKTL